MAAKAEGDCHFNAVQLQPSTDYTAQALRNKLGSYTYCKGKSTISPLLSEKQVYYMNLDLLQFFRQKREPALQGHSSKVGHA